MNLTVLWLYMKVFSAKFGAWCPLVWQKRAIHESFLCENRIFYQLRKFSPLKVCQVYEAETIAEYFLHAPTVSTRPLLDREGREGG